MEVIRAARRADLAEYLVRNHRADICVTGKCVYLKKCKSVYTRFGFSGYTDFATKETGNSIDFLMNHLNYSFQEAVDALTGCVSVTTTSPAPRQLDERDFTVPVTDSPPFKRVFAYLTVQRAIPADTVRKLVNEGLLYQEAGTGNAVFISRLGDFCELRGTLSDKKFHGIRRVRPNCFWSVKNSVDKPKTAYICEGAIDAISLMVLHQQRGVTAPAAYVSIGGVANQRSIDRIRSLIPAVLAVDNDEAGEACRVRNPELTAIIPVHKDWNEDLRH